MTTEKPTEKPIDLTHEQIKEREHAARPKHAPAKPNPTPQAPPPAPTKPSSR